MVITLNRVDVILFDFIIMFDKYHLITPFISIINVRLNNGREKIIRRSMGIEYHILRHHHQKQII